ncbi:MAG TPA: type II secretion system F family protein [Acidimicrobiia bacterium]|nr:type II secretion system F family protein [Acidimicrobiia bacterium]
MRFVLGGSAGLVVGGPVGAVLGAVAPWLWSHLARTGRADPPLNLVLLLLLIELRAGVSVLAALIGVSETLSDYASLRTVARVARVSGLMSALPFADEALRPVVAQLVRAQRSGASLTGSVRRLLNQTLAADRARRLASARTLPTRLMIPVTLLMLPGLILAMYAPSLLATFEDLTGGLT